MDVETFSRALREGMDPSEIWNDLPLEDEVGGANTEPTESHPSAEVFAAATAVEVENQRAGLQEQWDFYPGNNVVEGANAELTEPPPSAAIFVDPVAEEAETPLSHFIGNFAFSDTIGDEKKAMEELDRFFQSHNNPDVYISDPDQQQGVEHLADDGNQADNNLEEAMASHEHGSNNFTDSRISSIHCRNHRAGNAEAMASSQLVSAHSYNHGKDELDHIRNQKHSLINHKSSQEASCATSPEGIGDEDETQSTSAANIDGEETDPREPKEGMEFRSMDAVCTFYKNYAKQLGFKVRKGKGREEMKSKYFLCSCEGFKTENQINKPTKFKKPNTRTGCLAKIKCVRSDGTWKISEVALDHNHKLKGFLPVAHGREEDSRATTTTLSTDKIVNEVKTVGEQALVSDVDCSDVSRGRRKNHPMPEPEDTQDLINYFKKRQIEDPHFFSTAQAKAASMANFFWRDGRSKIDYEHFGDVLVLDTRTRIDTYGMICAVFWGLNNHRQRIIFGYAFLVDLTVDSLNWLLQSFLDAMSCHKLKTIITEVSDEITDALRQVLPEPSHCLPFWSILNGFRKNLSTLSDQPRVLNLFRECVFHVHSQEEFKSKWNSFVGEYGLHENTWLASLYGMREKWSHAFTKNVFSAGLISIQNDEDARAIFENLSCETMTLSRIAQWCESMAEQMRRKEFEEDVRSEKITSNLHSVEKEAERLYTRPIFKMFRKESRKILSLAIKEIEGMAPLHVFELNKQGSTKIDTVKYNPSDSTLVCSCGKFESVGILCFHALKVLNSINIFHIPPGHLLKRWTKSAKDSLPVDTPSAGTTLDGVPDNLFMGEFLRQALHVGHMSVNKKRKIIALAIMKFAWDYISKVPKTEEVKVALDDSDGNDDMDQTKSALKTHLEQENIAKSGIGCPRVKRKV